MVDVAARYHTSVGAVRQWRYRGIGPTGVKIGARVLYAEDEIARFEKSLLTTQTPA